MQTMGSDRLGDGAADDLSRTRVSVVGLDNDGASGGKRRGPVPYSDGDREREVARTEDDNGSDGNLALTDVQARSRCAVGTGGIDARSVEAPSPDHLREVAQLSDGTGHLTGEPSRRQPGLGHGAFDQGLAHGFDVAGNRLKERSAFARVERTVSGEGPLRSGDGPVDLYLVEESVLRCQSLPGGRIDGMRRRAFAAHRAT